VEGRHVAGVAGHRVVGGLGPPRVHAGAPASGRPRRAARNNVVVVGPVRGSAPRVDAALRRLR
jgi:hypothetical protein